MERSRGRTKQAEHARLKYFNNDSGNKVSEWPRCEHSEEDFFNDLCQQLNDLQKDFLNEDHNQLISDQKHFSDRDMDTEEFSRNLKHAIKVFTDRQKQVKCLFCTGTLSSSDSDMLMYEATLQQHTTEFNLTSNGQQQFAALKISYSNTFDM